MDISLLNAFIARTPASLAGIQKITVWTAIKEFLGLGKTYVFLVLNKGDVIKLDFVNPVSSNSCCVFVSGVDSEGNPIGQAGGGQGGDLGGAIVSYMSVDPVTLLDRFRLTFHSITYICTILPPPKNGVACRKS